MYLLNRNNENNTLYLSEVCGWYDLLFFFFNNNYQRCICMIKYSKNSAAMKYNYNLKDWFPFEYIF